MKSPQENEPSAGSAEEERQALLARLKGLGYNDWEIELALAELDKKVEAVWGENAQPSDEGAPQESKEPTPERNRNKGLIAVGTVLTGALAASALAIGGQSGGSSKETTPHPEQEPASVSLALQAANAYELPHELTSGHDTLRHALDRISRDGGPLQVYRRAADFAIAGDVITDSYPYSPQRPEDAFSPLDITDIPLRGKVERITYTIAADKLVSSLAVGNADLKQTEETLNQHVPPNAVDVRDHAIVAAENKAIVIALDRFKVSKQDAADVRGTRGRYFTDSRPLTPADGSFNCRNLQGKRGIG